jgi:hypothetical protein
MFWNEKKELKLLTKFLVSNFQDACDVRERNSSLLKMNRFGKHKDAVELLMNEFNEYIII